LKLSFELSINYLIDNPFRVEIPFLGIKNHP